MPAKRRGPRKTGANPRAGKPAKKRGRGSSGPGNRGVSTGNPSKPGKISTSRARKDSGTAVAKKAASTRSRKRGSRNEPQRLQKLLAAAGFGSRRQCETLIEEGRVEVDGEIVTELGTVVDPKSAKVRVDGVPLRQQKLVYYAVNKPTGVLSTSADPQGRSRVIDLVPSSERVYPVGRLDQSSQGLMLLTNDGDLAQQLAHPRYGVRKVYRVTVAGKIDSETMRNMRKGIYISDGFVRVEGARILKSRARATEMEITLREGKNREIRRILARLGHKVQVLRRIAIGPLRLGDLPAGAYRPLTRDEVRRLQLAVEHSRDEVEASRSSDASPKRKPRLKTGKKSTHSQVSSGGKRGKRRAETRSDVTKRRTRRKTPTTKFSFQPKRGPGGGAVIGGDEE
ncbi:MAG: pseudouridine synthase [Planctomycetota bacterium]